MEIPSDVERTGGPASEDVDMERCKYAECVFNSRTVSDWSSLGGAPTCYSDPLTGAQRGQLLLLSRFLELRLYDLLHYNLAFLPPLILHKSLLSSDFRVLRTFDRSEIGVVMF